MKLDFEIVRDLLLEIEDQVGLNQYLLITNVPGLKVQSSDAEIYAALKLHEAGFIEASVSKYLDQTIRIQAHSLTWAGHEFLDNIRPQTTWEKSKELANSIGGASIKILADIASKVATNLINTQLGNQ